MTLREAIIGHGKISYRSEGSGYPLVLLHGVGSGADSWEYQLSDLSKDFRVVAWDAPGYGMSTDLRADVPEAADYAKALSEFLAAIGVGECHVVGHSMGALVAAAFAERHAVRVNTLTLSNCASGYKCRPEEPLPENLQARLDDLRQLGAEEFAKKRATNLLSKSAGQDAVARVRDGLRRIREPGYERALRMIAGANIFAGLETLRMPVLVLHGSEDKVTPQTNVASVARAIPGAVFKSLAGLGHACYVEGPNEFNAALRDFIWRSAKRPLK